MDEIQGRSQPREREKICDRERKLFAVDSNISYWFESHVYQKISAF
jgi:hypothetical protein